MTHGEYFVGLMPEELWHMGENGMGLGASRFAQETRWTIAVFGYAQNCMSN